MVHGPDLDICITLGSVMDTCDRERLLAGTMELLFNETRRVRREGKGREGRCV